MVRLIFSIFLFLFFSKKETIFASDMYIVSPPAVDIIPAANYDAYTANIPEPYLTYVQSYISHLGIFEHYVAYVTQESKYVSGSTRTSMVYNIAVGENLLYTGNSFTGSVVIYKIYASTAYFPQFATVYDTSFSLYPGTDLVYSDLQSPYPDISPDTYDRYVFYAIAFFAVATTIFFIIRR